MKSVNRHRLPAKYGERAQTAAALALGKRGRKIEAKWKSEADRSESAIGVLRNALGMCKSEGDRSESAIGVLKRGSKTNAITPRSSRDITLRSPPIREAESAIGVLRNALGMCKSEGDKSESAIGVLRNALGMCKSEADRSESAIGVLRNALGKCKSEADKSESAIGVLKTSPKTLAGTRGTPANVSRHSTKISPH